MKSMTRNQHLRKKEFAEKILNVLRKQKFADWYNDGGRFDSYITVLYPEGDEFHISKEEILADIVKLFDL